jgi:hypothetical protein
LNDTWFIQSYYFENKIVEWLKNLLAMFDIFDLGQNKIDTNNEFDPDKTVDQIIEDV